MGCVNLRLEPGQERATKVHKRKTSTNRSVVLPQRVAVIFQMVVFFVENEIK